MHSLAGTVVLFLAQKFWNLRGTEGTGRHLPKRVIDGEGVWKSEKLKHLDISVRSEYSNILPIATSNGVFECDPALVWSAVYSFNRPEITREITEQILEEFASGGLLYRWIVDGKTWGYFVGIDKPGRLPGPSRAGIHEKAGPPPGLFELGKYIEETRSRNGFVYFIQGRKTKCIKIGFSRSPFKRMDLHQVGSPDILELIGLAVGQWELETALHKRFAASWSHGEWFKPTAELYAEIKKISVTLENSGIQKLLGFGFGSGFGLGLGSGVGAESKEADSTKTGTGGDLPLAFTGRVLRISAELHKQFESAYQTLHVVDHYAEADLWLVTHPEKQRKNHPAFMRNWLKTAVSDVRTTQVRSEASVGSGPSAAGVALKPHVLERLAREAKK